MAVDLLEFALCLLIATLGVVVIALLAIFLQFRQFAWIVSLTEKQQRALLATHESQAAQAVAVNESMSDVYKAAGDGAEEKTQSEQQPYSRLAGEAG